MERGIKMINLRFLKQCTTKWRKLGQEISPLKPRGPFSWSRCPRFGSEESIPKDVPKGHLVIYVGEKCRRFVVRVTLLMHPLFKSLLDQAQEEYDFTSYSKLWIPCDEILFESIICRIQAQQARSICLCF
ncbi:hypothetical protein AMTR_s00148p00095340 [Amborella trichopoda]|uniref:Uncharacterized protein n=1 Tax=Amborella trichopoda TaxID=13333 RepID=W1PK62_AMBTC|nr:hypothetical protein AMTR_s00148p00095340 [Amborella trichopoda]